MSEFLDGLTKRLEERRAELADEQRVIAAALVALGAGTRRARPREKLSDRGLMAIIAEDPGVRTSMLALSFHVQPERLSPVLTSLQASGAIERWELGWRATS